MNLLTITNEVLKIKNVSIKCVRILDIVPPEMFMKLGKSIMVIPLDDGQVKEKSTSKEITPKTKHTPEHGEL